MLFAHTSCVASLPYNECWFVDDDGQANTMPIAAVMGYVYKCRASRSIERKGGVVHGADRLKVHPNHTLLYPTQLTLTLTM